MMWEIREPIYNEIVKRIKETGKSYWTGIIDGQGWSFHGSIIINNEEIIPIWWDFDLANADNIILTFFHGDSAENEIECKEMVSILTLMDFIKNR